MVKISQVLKFLSSINPNLTPTRVSFYNYLSYFCEPDEVFDCSVLDGFFAHALDYAHWIQNRGSLTQEIKGILESIHQQNPLDIDFSEMRWAADIQVIEIESTIDWVETTRNYIKTQIAAEQKFRLIHDEQFKKNLVLVQQLDGGLEVYQFDRKFIFKKGQLVPLKKNICLHYSSDLELSRKHKHKIEIAPFVMAQFTVSPKDEAAGNLTGNLTGNLLRGYLCQKFFEFKAESALAYPKLFYSIKRIESFFVDRRTDNFYNDLVQALERTNALVRVNDPEAISDSLNILAQAQNALDYVFMGDKFLTLLVRDLQHTLNSNQTKTLSEKTSSWTKPKIKTSFDSINSLPTVASPVAELPIG